MLWDCATLRGKIADARSRDSNNTILHRKFTVGSITMSAASSPAGLAVRSIRYCLLDEVDRYPASAGSEGDPVNLAVTRTANYWNRKIVLCSTPTVKGASRIEAAWLESNQQMHWVPCPHCGAHQILRWPNVDWPEGEPEKAQYRSEHCGLMIGEHQKAWMLKHGEWRAARPDRDATVFGSTACTRRGESGETSSGSSWWIRSRPKPCGSSSTRYWPSRGTTRRRPVLI